MAANQSRGRQLLCFVRGTHLTTDVAFVEIGVELHKAAQSIAMALPAGPEQGSLTILMSHQARACSTQLRMQKHPAVYRHAVAQRQPDDEGP